MSCLLAHRMLQHIGRIGRIVRIGLLQQLIG